MFYRCGGWYFEDIDKYLMTVDEVAMKSLQLYYLSYEGIEINNKTVKGSSICSDYNWDIFRWLFENWSKNAAKFVEHYNKINIYYIFWADL